MTITDMELVEMTEIFGVPLEANELYSLLKIWSNDESLKQSFEGDFNEFITQYKRMND